MIAPGTLITHPDNEEALKNAFRESALPRSVIRPVDHIVDMPVVFDESAPKRHSDSVWHPPQGGQFTDYGPEDEAWMRPLGIGTVEIVDRGPALWMLDTSIFDYVCKSFAIPPTLFRGYM